MKKYQLLFKISAVFSYLFFVFGLSQMTLIIQNYWQFSSQIGNFVWIQNFLSLLFSGVMIWILVKTGHGYLFHIPRKKWLWYSILTVLVVVLQISFNVQTAKHVQSTAEGWAVLIGYSGTNFAGLTRYTKSIYPSYAVHVINNIVATFPFLLTFLHRVLG